MAASLLDYCQQTPWTHPGHFVQLYDHLPDALQALCAVPRNVMIHTWEASRDGLLLGDRRRDLERRSIAEILSLCVETGLESLLTQCDSTMLRVIDCRHFATLLCSLLRHKHIPARVRFGFAQYIAEPGADPPYVAHAVCEWWDSTHEEWRLSDPDIVQDVTHDQFYSAADAWRRARADSVDPERFGYEPNLRGLAVIGAELVRDAACRAGFEPLYGDSWGVATELYERPIQSHEVALFDTLAAADDAVMAKILGRDRRIAIPRQIHHFAYARGEGYTVDLDAERSKLQQLGVPV